MRFGINFFPSFRPEDSTTAAYYDQCIRLAVRAEELGFHSVKTVEHSFFDYGGHSPNPIVFLAAMAARTSRIRIMTGAVIPAFHHPVHVAGEFAMLDNLSNGRVEAGFGRGFLPKEFEVYGADLDDSRSLFDEAVAVIRRLWTEQSIDHHGTHWSFDDVRLMPRVVQQPHPPVWVACTTSEESFVNAARNGFNIMVVPYAGPAGLLPGYVQTYRRVWAESGHEAGREQVQLSTFACLAESSAAAHAGFERLMTRYLQTFAEAVAGWKNTSSRQYPDYQRVVDGVSSLTPALTIEKKAAFVGTPSEVVDQLSDCIALYGEVEPSMQINFGGTTDAEAFHTLDLFAREVMPAFG